MRKHLSRLKGGGLARAAAPARVVALVLSDVVGDDLSTIGSGPTVPDPTTFAQALAVLERRGVLGEVPAAVRDRLARRRPRRSRRDAEAGAIRCFRRVATRIVGERPPERPGRGARGAAAGPAPRRPHHTARRRGAGGRARAGRDPARGVERATPASGPGLPPRRRRDHGHRAGRRARAVGTRSWPWRQHRPSRASRGRRSSPAWPRTGSTARATAPGASWTTRPPAAATRLGLAPAAVFLAANDTRNYLGPLGDLILTGPTGTNVADIVALLATPAARKGYNAQDHCPGGTLSQDPVDDPDGQENDDPGMRQPTAQAGPRASSGGRRGRALRAPGAARRGPPDRGPDRLPQGQDRERGLPRPRHAATSSASSTSATRSCCSSSSTSWTTSTGRSRPPSRPTRATR